MCWQVGTWKYVQTVLTLCVVIPAHQSQQCVCLVLCQPADGGPHSAEGVHLLPGLAQGEAPAVLGVSAVQGVEECSVHDSTGQQSCLLPGVPGRGLQVTLKVSEVKIHHIPLIRPTFSPAALLLLPPPALFCMKVSRANRKERKAKAE